MFLACALSTALVLLPVWPGARAASEGHANEPAGSGAAREFAPFAAPLAAPLAPSLTATKTDSFPDPDNDGKAEPGDTITYNITVTNSGPDDATNVVFSDTVDPNTTLVPGSVRTQPVAAGDSYNVLGNVRIQPGAGAGLLSNDCDPDNGAPCNSFGLTASGPSASAQGGEVVVSGDGSFSYNPPAGFNGIDSFTYTVTDPSGLTDTATVTLEVDGMVWFVDNTAPAGGDGRLTAPFNSLAPLNGGADADEPSDFIFVYEGAGAYGGGITLEDSQGLIGQGTDLDAALALFGVSAPAGSDALPTAAGRPLLENSAGHVITLANGNAVLHLNAAASAALSSAVSGSNVNGFTLSHSTLNGVHAGTRESAVSLTNLSGSASVSDCDIGGGTGDSVRVVNTTGTLDRLTISDTIVRFDAGIGNDGVHFEALGAGAVMNLTVTGSAFKGARSDMIEATAPLGTTMDVVVRGNSFTNEQSNVVSGNTPIIVQGAGTVTYDISCNRVQQTDAAGTVGTAQGHGINVAKSALGGSFSGTIFNNLIGKTGVANSGAGTAGAAIQLLFHGTGTHTSLVKNNQLRNYGESAMRVFGNSGNATADVTIVGNLATEPDPNFFTFAGLFADVGALPGDTNTLNLKFGGAGAEENDFTNSEPFDFSDLFLSVNSAGAAINLSRGVSVASDLQQIITDNNADPVFAFGSGTINFVNSVPALPAAVDETCSAPLARLAPADSLVKPAGADVQVAAAGPGLSADREFAGTALRKIRAGFAHSERAQLLAVEADDARPAVPRALRTAAATALAGETITLDIGTLLAGDSVTITFQVTVANPFPSNVQPQQVSNQGTVTADGGISVLTDDPTEPGGADPTVTPILVLFNFSGFFSPVSNPPALNTVQAGRAIPIKFSLGGDKGLNIFAAGYPASAPIACASGVPEEEVPTVTAGGSSLSYDADTDTYTYIWKTQSSWAGTCRQFIIKLTDGTTHVANFKLR